MAQAGYPVVARVLADGPGFAATANAAARDGGRADLVLVGVGVDVPPDAAERLGAAVAAEATAATASALHEGGPWSAPEAAAVPRRPRLPGPSGGCVLVRRAA